MSQSENAPEGFDVVRAFAALYRRAPLILTCATLAALAAFALSRTEQKTYQATASLGFSENPLSQQIAGLPTTSNPSSALVQQASNVELVRLGETAESTAKTLGGGLTPSAVADDVSVSGLGESGIVAVTAHAGSPALAAAIANTYVQQFVSAQTSINRHYYASALALVRRQLRGLSPAQRVGQDGLALQNRAQTLTLLSQLRYGNVTVAGQATPPSAPSSPRTSRNVLIGAALGLLLGIAAVFVLEQLDPRVKRAREIEEIFGAPLLGSVAASPSLARTGDGQFEALPQDEAAVFALMRAQMALTRPGRAAWMILVTAAARGEGVSTIARELALSAARSGARVLLINADGGARGSVTGPTLADVLADSASMEETINQVAFVRSGMDASARGTLAVLDASAGSGELVESQAFDDVLSDLRASHDLVVIDTPPLIEGAEGYPLLGKADGVVVVAKLARVSRDRALELRGILERANARVIGVVANGAGRRYRSRGRERSAASAPSSAGSTAKAASAAPEQVLTR